ncbi:unnamed protein product [Amaranthus hypochondriacus]
MQIDARLTEKLTMSTKEEIKNELAKEILLEAETIAILGVVAAEKEKIELQRNALKEIMLKSDDLKCIPCGQNCISSRNCCSPCHCNFTGPVPLCTR